MYLIPVSDALNAKQSNYFDYCEKYLRTKFHRYTGPYSFCKWYFQGKFISSAEFKKTLFSKKNADNKTFELELSELYKIGFVQEQLIKCSFHEFNQALIFGNSLYKKPLDYRPQKPLNSSFRKKETHKPKQLTEQEKIQKEWREAKGFARDYRKKEKINQGKAYIKKANNRFHRAWQKQQLHLELFDDLPLIETNQFKTDWGDYD